MIYEDIIKLAKTFATSHRQYANTYDSMDDYISELVEAALEGLNTYDNTKSSISTWCYTVFGNKVLASMFRQLRYKRTAEVYSLDETISDDASDCLYDVIADMSLPTCEDIETSLHNSLICQKIMPYISDMFKERVIQNKTLVDIAKERHVTKQHVGQQLKREQAKLRYALEHNDFSKLKSKEKANEHIQFCL